ncbi:MAG TPA: formate dehydrogenase accessory protein FdhE [Opitutaceae bacterium]|nr:formate dehydrogenase accessory protein FdhE [Opitutaceae bacterium]
MHIELLVLQRRVQSRVPLPPLEVDANIFQRHQLEGRPLLQFEHIPLDLTDLRLMVRQVADVLHRFDALDASEFQLAHNLGRGGQLLEVAGRWYRRVAERAMAATTAVPAAVAAVPPPGENEQPEIVGHVLTLAMRPFLSRCAEVLQRCPELAAWSHAHCPLCGGEPDLACLDAHGERHLVCGRCLLQWHFDAVTCPFCLNADRARITSFGTSDGHYRVYGCDVCRRYVKAFDSRRASRPLMPVLDGVAMLPLDAAAMQRGYSS